MQITDFIFQYLYEIQGEGLKTDPDYQSAKAARNEAEKALVFAMTPKQRRMFHDYAEKARLMDALELRRLFSHCTLLLDARETKARPPL